MVDRVTHHMDQRIANILHHFAVEFDFAPARDEFDLLAQLLRKIANDARQRREQLVDALHPHLADRLAHRGNRIGQSVERSDDCGVGAGFAQHPGKFVAREHDVGDAGHHAVEQRQRHPDRTPTLHVGLQIIVAPRADFAVFDLGFGRRVGLRFDLRQRTDHIAVIASGFVRVLAERVADERQAVEDGKHRGDERAVGSPLAAPHIVERLLGSVRQRGNARQRQKPRTALDRMDEPENCVEPLAIGRVRFPRHDGCCGLGQQFRRFGKKIVQQLVHCGPGAPKNFKRFHARQWLTEALVAPLIARLENRSDQQRCRRFAGKHHRAAILPRNRLHQHRRRGA